MRTVLLVPRRDDGAERDELWRYCRWRWESLMPDVPIYEGHQTAGPFNRSMAVNTAARIADEEGPWDVGIVIDSDIFIDIGQVRTAVHVAATEGKVTWAHRRWRGINADWTKRTVADRTDFGPDPATATDMDVLVERTNPISWSCCIAVPRAVWDELGGFDERFVGWGFEDMAFQSAVCGLFGHRRIEGDVYHLHHPRVSGSGKASREDGSYTREAVTNARLGRRYMVALRRDHGLHDRPDGPMSDEERARDIRNLTLDDEKLAHHARRLGLPDWSDWWPGLEELVAGAKEARTDPFPTVTIVVHTDGRRQYIARSIPSLVERVTGPIVKRVIYDDSGDPEYKAWLTEEFGPLGFYVVGPAERQGYTGSMRAMWKYLADRCSSEFVFAVEDDFVYERDVDLSELAAVLRARPYLAQLALLRKPAYQSEVDAGGVLGWASDSFTPVSVNGWSWLEHRNFWTANPSLFRRELTVKPWPLAKSSERVFGDELLRNKSTRFAFWGDGQPMIEHIGAERAGIGY